MGGLLSPVFAGGRGDELDACLIESRPAVSVPFAPADKTRQKICAVVVDGSPYFVGNKDLHGHIVDGDFAIQFQQEPVTI